MKRKERIVAASILSVMVLAVVTLAYAATKAPDKDIVIRHSDVFTAPKKSPVTFSHEKHKGAKCVACHHEYENGKNVWKEGQEVKKCSACHKLKAEGKKEKLDKAFHTMCIGCHKKMKEAGKKAGPQKSPCSKCHPLKPGEKEQPEKSS